MTKICLCIIPTALLSILTFSVFFSPIILLTSVVSWFLQETNVNFRHLECCHLLIICLVPNCFFSLSSYLTGNCDPVTHTKGTIHRVIILPFDAIQSKLNQHEVIKYTINITHTIRSHTLSHLVQLHNILQYLKSWKLHNIKYYWNPFLLMRLLY